jgi:hypothetical protein
MTAGEAGAAARTMIVALALARFIASYPAAKSTNPGTAHRG